MRGKLSRLFQLFCVIFFVLSNKITAADNILDLENCKKLVEDMQTTAAIEKCTPLAKKGIAEAQYFLGDLYNNAPDENKSVNNAFNWYLKAARQGHLASQNNVSYKYRYGEGVDKDLKKSFYWVKKAADRNLTSAQYNLGNMYIKGLGTKPDPQQGIKWVKTAAQKQNQFAEAYLGYLYLKGIGTPKDEEQAAKWFYRAAKQGHILAQIDIGKLYDEGRGIKKDISAAIRWFTQAALQGSLVGYGYVKYYADKNNLLAQTNMGLIHINGAGKRDFDEAYKWLTLAAKGGSAEAQYNLGIAYELGMGTKIDLQQAKTWFEKSSTQGFELAQTKLNELKQNPQEGQLKE